MNLGQFIDKMFEVEPLSIWVNDGNIKVDTEDKEFAKKIFDDYLENDIRGWRVNFDEKTGEYYVAVFLV
jgi:hypothetical protein